MIAAIRALKSSVDSTGRFMLALTGEHELCRIPLRTASTETGGSGMSNSDAKEMAQMITAVVQAQIEKQKRSGGSLYVPHSQRVS
jgi:hypothetical protein